MFDIHVLTTFINVVENSIKVAVGLRSSLVSSKSLKTVKMHRWKAKLISAAARASSCHWGRPCFDGMKCVRWWQTSKLSGQYVVGCLALCFRDRVYS